MLTTKLVQYNIPNPPSKLKHKKMNILEWFISKIMSSHVCQVCGRKELWSVSGWLQINHPKYRDKDGCSVVCFECEKMNPEIFRLARIKKEVEG